MPKNAIVILCGVISGFWTVQALAENPVGFSAGLVLVVDKGIQGVPYLSGGIGETEREEILAREQEFNLKLLFAEKSGAYLTDVRLMILTSSGQSVLVLDSAGPYLLVKLPPGHYQVQATANNQRQRITLQIGENKRVSRVLHW